MREEFTGQLRLVLEKAQAAGRSLNQDFVGAEHLMLGVLDCPESEAAAVLRRGEINLVELRDAQLADLPRGETDPVVTGNLPLSPKAMRAVNNAIVKAQAHREARVSSRHLLLSLLDETDGIMRQDLRDAGADLDLIQRVLAEAAQSPES